MNLVSLLKQTYYFMHLPKVTCLNQFLHFWCNDGAPCVSAVVEGFFPMFAVFSHVKERLVTNVSFREPILMIHFHYCKCRRYKVIKEPAKRLLQYRLSLLQICWNDSLLVHGCQPLAVEYLAQQHQNKLPTSQCVMFQNLEFMHNLGH